MRPTGSTLYYFFFILFLFSNSYAQVFPMQGSLQITPPYTPYLSDYTTAGEQKLTLQLRPNDITLGDHPVRLRLTIEGVGITIRTRANYIPPTPHTLMGGGAPTLLYGDDLIEYFNPDNLDFAGFSKSDFQQSGKLPEGVYRFSFEVLDYYRQVSLSSKIMTVAWIVLNDPPLLNLPLNNTKVTIIDPTNIAFTWTPRHTSSPNSAFTTEYVFKMVEVWPVSRNAYDAFLSQPALYETTLTESQLLYGPSEPALLPGHKYAWQVQARDDADRDVFKNQGKSEVYVFQFGDLLGIPENLHKEGVNDQALTLAWEPAVRGETPALYHIRYKAASAESWSEILSDKQWLTLTSLKPNTDYEVQVRGKLDDVYSDYTPLLRAKTAEKAANFVCGQPPATVITDKTSRLLQLTPGDIFTCNDWRIVVREASRSTNGEFSGKGLMAVKMFAGASIEVIFHGAINAGYQLITGGVESTYKKGSEMGSVVEEMKKIGEKKPTTSKTPTDTTGIDQVVFPGIIDSVYFNKEKKEVVVVDKEGKKTTYPQKTDTKTQEAKPMRITDSAGNTVTVGKDGTVTKGGTGGAAGGTGGNTTASTDPQVNILMKEILASFSKDIDDHLGENTPIKKGPSTDFYDSYFNKPDCLPDDAATLRNIRAYSNELQSNSGQLDQFVKTILKKEENRTYFNNLVKNTLAGYNQKKSYKETLSTEEYNKVRETTCPYLVKGERDTKKLADLKSIVVKGKDCADKLDTAYVRGMMNGIIDRSGSTYNTLTSLEGWKNILSGGCILLYNIALCANPAAPMSPECLEFYGILVEAGKKYAEGLLQENCYKRGYAWGEMIVDVLAIKGLEVLATGTIKIAGRVIKATTVETKLVPVIKSTVGLGFVSSLSNNLLKFGIKLGGKTLKTWSFITLLNIEIFRYSLNNGRFVFANSLRTTTASTILYTIRDIHYATDVNPSIKFATIEIVKDAAGKVAWRELATEGAGRYAQGLTGALKYTYDDLVRAGYKVIDDGGSIIFKNANDLPIAKISGDALHIKIPDNHGGWAKQSNTTNAISALNKVNSGDPLYRIGTLNHSAAAEAQYWSLENPLNTTDIKAFAQKYGIPEANLKQGGFFVEIAKPKPTTPKISREAPGAGGNTGGSIEIVIPTNMVTLESFHTIKF